MVTGYFFIVILSYLFIFFFLPLALLAYYAAPKKLRLLRVGEPVVLPADAVQHERAICSKSIQKKELAFL
ncbi:MAG: hypothetical protein J6Y92_02785 [Lentisphaeria bacterium]|nr:hypothetical protein [Lentisphaeria bacterium]